MRPLTGPAAWMALVLAGTAAVGQVAPTPPPLDPAPTTLRIWGNHRMERLVQAWAEGYARRYPGRRVETRLLGRRFARGDRQASDALGLVESTTKTGDPNDPSSVTTETRSYDVYGNLEEATSVTRVRNGRCPEPPRG